MDEGGTFYRRFREGGDMTRTLKDEQGFQQAETRVKTRQFRWRE